MSEEVRVFVDFWNLQLQWNKITGGSFMDWVKLPDVLVREAMKVTGLSDHHYHGTTVYASIDVTTANGKKHRQWINSFLDKVPGVNTHVRERRPKPTQIHCKNCDSEISDCPVCNQPLLKAYEKGIDSAIVTDLLSLAWANAYTVAILASSDADFIPAVENLQAKGYKVINATWRKLGFQLAQKCWASIEIDNLITDLTRS